MGCDKLLKPDDSLVRMTLFKNWREEYTKRFLCHAEVAV